MISVGGDEAWLIEKRRAGTWERREEVLRILKIAEGVYSASIAIPSNGPGESV